MKKLKSSIFILITILSFQAMAQEGTTKKEDKPELTGFLRNYTGVLLQSPSDFSIIQNTVDLTLEQKKDKTAFKINGFAYQYPYGENTVGLREAYMDFYSKKIDLRIGKQQIVWGQADGVFITDIVSPKNLTEFLLWDFNEIRLGVTAIKAKFYPNDNNDLELVYIPAFTPTMAPTPGSIWSPTMDFIIPPTFDYSKASVGTKLENGELFARYSLSASAIDLQLIGGYTMDDDPTMHIAKEFSVDTVTKIPQLTELTITPQHHRLALAGGSFSKDVEGFMVRGEAAYYFGKYFQTTDPMATDGLVERDYVNYVVGLDKTIGDWKLSGQFIQKIIFDHDDLMQNEKVDNLATLMINRTIMREKVRLELFSYVGLNNEDAFVRVRGFYFPQDGVSIEVGTNLFVGNAGLFGQYNSNDMVYTRLKYNF